MHTSAERREEVAVQSSQLTSQEKSFHSCARDMGTPLEGHIWCNQQPDRKICRSTKGGTKKRTEKNRGRERTNLKDERSELAGWLTAQLKKIVDNGKRPSEFQEESCAREEARWRLVYTWGWATIHLPPGRRETVVNGRKKLRVTSP